eukprot:345826-Hanusia_phi.AAC.1
MPKRGCLRRKHRGRCMRSETKVDVKEAAKILHQPAYSLMPVGHRHGGSMLTIRGTLTGSSC